MKTDGTIHVWGKPVCKPVEMMTWGAATWPQSVYAGDSPAVVDVATQDIVALIKCPFVRELPQAFFDVMAADVDGLLAEDYRYYIRHEIKPILDRFADILHAHFAAIEAPSLEWLIETFPGHGGTDSSNNFADNVVAYARAWGRVLAEWDTGQLDVLFPPHHMMPCLGLMKLNNWSKERGETKQQELIGMSSGRKDASTKRHASAELQNVLASDEASEV